MKTKNMFIGLGAVAALGAAVIPMASYAASDSGTVDINLELALLLA